MSAVFSGVKVLSLDDAPLLRSSNEKLSYEVIIDASAVSLGVVLLQGREIILNSQPT